jgi:Uma2 family endonuclease
MHQVLNKPGTIPADEPADRLWTRDEYDRLVEQGFFDGQRVELVEGRIVEMPAQKVPHRVALELVDAYVRRAFPSGHRYCIQMPFRTAEGSEPEPDVAVVPGDARGSSEHPSSASLVVEVSDTTLRYDRHKARVYAASGVAEYWILNLVDRCLEVHRDPFPGGGTPNGPAYASVKIYAAADSIAPLAALGSAVTVAQLLP